MDGELTSTPGKTQLRGAMPVQAAAAGERASGPSPSRAGMPGRSGLRRPLASSIIVPPFALYLGVLTVVLGASSLLLPYPSGWSLWRPVLLAALHVPLLYAGRAVAMGRDESPLQTWVVAASSVWLALLLDVTLADPNSPWPLLALIAVLSFCVLPVAGLWRRVWERYLDQDVTLLALNAKDARAAAARLERVPGLEVARTLLLDIEDSDLDAAVPASSALGTEAHGSETSTVVVSNPSKDPALRVLVAQLVARGCSVVSESHVIRHAEGRVDSTVADPLTLLLSRPRSTLQNALSRVMDLILTVPALILLSPLFLVISLVIRLTSPGPAYFRQWRLGKRGRPFKVIKFRTMVEDAEAASGPVWASEDDPRITRVGRFLRRTRLDELPQLINVVLGEMALVGPRPERPHFFKQLRADVPLFELRTAVPPGITGWAQVRAPYAADVSDAREKLDHDLYYLLKRSPWFDLAIILETVGTALGGKGSR